MFAHEGPDMATTCLLALSIMPFKRTKIKHVHIGGKGNEKFLDYMKMKYVRTYNIRKPSERLSGHHRLTSPKSIPYYTINSIVSKRKIQNTRNVVHSQIVHKGSTTMSSDQNRRKVLVFQWSLFPFLNVPFKNAETSCLLMSNFIWCKERGQRTASSRWTSWVKRNNRLKFKTSEIPNHNRGIRGLYLNLLKKKRNITTCVTGWT